MKKTILAACILIGIATASYAQIEKGDIIGGINGNFSYTKYHGRNMTSLGLNAYSLYTLKHKFAVGLSLDNTFSNSKIKGQDTLTYTSYILQITPEVRKYFGSNRLMPFLGLSTGLAYSYTSLPGFATFKNYEFYLAPEGGISYWLNDKVFLDFKVKYDLVNPNNAGSPLIINFGIGIKLGK